MSTPRYVGTAEELLTPVVFCALDPPEDPPLLFYRLPVAPDLTLTKDDVPWDLVRDVPLLWVTGTGVSTEPARQTQLDMLAHRGRPDAADRRCTVLDLDWRPMFWPSPQDARREYELMLDHVTVAVGNRAEVEVAVGTADPEEAARRLLDHGVELALVKKGAEGVLVATRDEMSTVAPQLVEVVCGLGAGDAFGGALVHGLLSGWDPVRIAEYANAAGAIVVAQLACADAMPTLEELEAMVAGGGSRHERRPRRTTRQHHAPGRSPMMPQRSVTSSGATAGDPRHPARGGRGGLRQAASGRRGCSPSAARSSWWPPTTPRGAPWPPAPTRWRWPTGAACSNGS